MRIRLIPASQGREITLSRDDKSHKVFMMWIYKIDYNKLTMDRYQVYKDQNNLALFTMSSILTDILNEIFYNFFYEDEGVYTWRG